MSKRRLPPNVNAVKDRHGRIRYRYRRQGVKGGYLPGEPWSQPWLNALAALQGQTPAEKIDIQAPRRVPAYTMDDLAAKMRATVRWKRQAEATQRVYGRIIERLMDRTNKRRERFGSRDARKIDVASLEKLLGTLADKPGAATKLRHVLVRLFTTAVKLGWRTDNPAAVTDPISQRGEGFHTWTDDEIASYRAHHRIGTTPRLVLELALNTAARRCNLHSLSRSQIVGDKIHIAHAKGGDETVVDLLEETREALEAAPVSHIDYLIVNAYGRPFSVEGLGNSMRKWADAAGLPGCSLHGLRKAQARRLAEAGATNAEGRAITGHKTDAMFNHYSAKANRKKLASNAMAKLRDNLSNPSD